MDLTREIADLYSTWVWVRVRKSFITSTSWVWVQFGARSMVWSMSSYSREFYNLGAWFHLKHYSVSSSFLQAIFRNVNLKQSCNIFKVIKLDMTSQYANLWWGDLMFYWLVNRFACWQVHNDWLVNRRFYWPVYTMLDLFTGNLHTVTLSWWIS